MKRRRTESERKRRESEGEDCQARSTSDVWRQQQQQQQKESIAECQFSIPCLYHVEARCLEGHNGSSDGVRFSEHRQRSESCQ